MWFTTEPPLKTFPGVCVSQAIASSHVWVVAATITLSDGLAKQAERRGTVRIPEDTKIDVLETYCAQCRRPYEDVAGANCEAAESRDHLIGGPTGERKKRKHPFHDCGQYDCHLTPATG